MVPGLPSQLELRVDSKPSACSPHCGAPTAPVYGAAAQEKKKPCYVPPDHAGGSTTLGLRWSLVGGSMADATLGHMIFRHRSHTECTQQRGMHTRSASLLSCRLALSCRFAAPLEFARAQGRPVQPTMLVMPATTPVKTPISVNSMPVWIWPSGQCPATSSSPTPILQHASACVLQNQGIEVLARIFLDAACASPA